MERMPQPRLRRGMTMKRQNPTAPAGRDDTLYLPACYTPSITRQHPVPTLGYCSRAKVACSSKAPKLLELSGGLRAHPARYKDRTEVSCPNSIGDPPSHISIARKNIWAELISQLPEGHLQSADRFLLEVVTGLMAKQRNRRTLITKGELSLLINALSKLGLTPTDRARVIIP